MSFLWDFFLSRSFRSFSRVDSRLFERRLLSERSLLLERSLQLKNNEEKPLIKPFRNEISQNKMIYRRDELRYLLSLSDRRRSRSEGDSSLSRSRSLLRSLQFDKKVCNYY